MQASEDQQLVARILAKERTAFDEFFSAYFPRLSRFCMTRVQDVDAVEDIVQETLLKALRNLHSYRGEAMLFSWLCTICRNEITNWYQRHGRKQAMQVSLDDNPTVQVTLESFGLQVQNQMIDQVALADLVQLTLDYLPDNYGKALEMKYLQGASVKEIAASLGMGRLATQSLLARARGAFRKGFVDIQQDMPAV